MKKTIILLIIVFPFFIKKIGSEEKITQQQDPSLIERISPLQTKSPMNNFILLSEKLSKLSDADEKLWIDVGENKNLLLKHISTYKKNRGNILMFHSQGENALHTRLITPLTQQLMSLGWNVYIPNLVDEDFPKELPFFSPKPQLNETVNKSAISDEPKKKNTENESTELTPNLTSKNIFQSTSEYQSYFKSLCSGIFEQTKILELPLIIIANQHSAYWSIECLKLTDTVPPIVFLQPEVPKEIKVNLSDVFSKQNTPFFSFTDPNKFNHFDQVLKKGFWSSKSQMFNKKILSGLKLEEQNSNLAKTITGWIERQKKHSLSKTL